ncbi:ADP-ribosylglycohydrolase family protein [Trueperella pyogenes]|uniref:ADP-ribosylglycohydrolase family protein n=1 Tax=Trueperella pyogenes TaxID=1661 RepID=A0ABV3NAX4_9ACTO
MEYENKQNHIMRNAHVDGVLAGVALGDSFGMPGELWTRSTVQKYFDKIEDFLPGPDGHFVVDGFKAGQYTDDTQQTLMLARTIIETGGEVRCEDVARNLVAWADAVGASEGNFLGPTSAKAINLLRAGANPRTLEADGETNGAAMRITPIGVVRSLTDMEGFLDAVEESCYMSHRTSVAISGAALIAGIVSEAVEQALSDREIDLMQCVDAGIAAASAGLQRGKEVVSAHLPTRAKLAVKIAYESSDDEDFSQRIYDEIGSSVLMIDSAPAAVGLLVRSGGDPMKAAYLAANLGGDTDTIGAMACGMAGAISGIGSIPQRALDLIAEVNGNEFLELNLLPYRR